MRLLAWIMWATAIAWMAAAIIGALGFQDLYGGWSGVQVIVVAAIVAVVPTAIGWWAYRRSQEV